MRPYVYGGNLMNNPFKRDEVQTPLDVTLQHLFSEIAGYDIHTDEYAKAADQIVKLVKLKKETNSSWKPSPDALLAAGATIATTILVLHYEKMSTVTSKAFGFIRGMK
jgi:hypothetical protein